MTQPQTQEPGLPGVTIYLDINHNSGHGADPFGDTLILGNNGDTGEAATKSALFGDELYLAPNFAQPVNWGDGAPGGGATGPYLTEIRMLGAHGDADWALMEPNEPASADGDVVTIKALATAVLNDASIGSEAETDFML